MPSQQMLGQVFPVTCTCHFIDRLSWTLHSMVLGLFEKKGTSKAPDVVDYLEAQLTYFDLSYPECVAAVTDTESTMVAAGRLIKQNSARAGGNTEWMGCIAHLLELVTGIAFDDTPSSEGTLKACRDIVNFFNSSTQAMQKLLGKQAQGRAVKPIQDVVTRWWSTYSMLTRLLRLMTYLQLLEEEGENRCNLTPAQWVIVKDLAALLSPFMVAQKLLEGEAYVTISFIPFIIYTIRKGLQEAITDANSSKHVTNTASRMLAEFNTRFGTGADGTVATENQTEGPRRRPKGIHMIQLMSSFLDPRMKAGVGISAVDKEYIWGEIRTRLIILALTIAAENAGPQVIAVQEAPIQPQQPRRIDHEHDDIFHELN